MRRRRLWKALAAAAVVLAAGAYPLDSPSASGDGVSFDDGSPGVLVLRSATYRLTLSRRTGALVALTDTRSGLRVVRGTNGCEWSAVAPALRVGGCALARSGAGVRYRWDARRSTLTLTYRSASAARKVDAVVTLHALRSYFDLRLRLANRSAPAVRRVGFPADLQVPVRRVTAGYAPNFLPGVMFTRAFFRRTVDDLFTYPSRGAFADYLALDLGRASLSVYSVNPAPAPLAPVELGFTHGQVPAPCSGTLFCLRHAFATWILRGRTWTSPIVRVRVGEPVERSILDYRTDNGIAQYPSAAAKLGSRLAALAEAPLVKVDPDKGLPPFSGWAPFLRRLPSPSLLHPVGFQSGGFDANDPDFLPPDPRWGTEGDFAAVIEQAHTLGQLVMPYLNAGWWDASSPTVRTLPPGQTLRDLSVQDGGGRAVTERFGSHKGYVVSPYVPFVRARVARLIDQFASSDCLFFDQVGSRSWLYDFNPASPTPLAYQDGWLSFFGSYAGRCLMAEDGWDRLAAAFSGFHGGLMVMQRNFQYPNAQWGVGTWQAFPLALWLLHDKVLLYQHDLCECTFTTDPQILTWNLAFGLLLSYGWDEQAHSLESPWLAIVTAFQRALGPRYAGAALTSYRRIASGVTETRFGAYSVVANWTGSPYALGGYRIAPGGFLARMDDGSLAAGEFADLSGATYRIVQDGKVTFSLPVPG